MTEVTRVALELTGLPLDERGRPKMLFRIDYVESPPKFDEARDEVNYSDFGGGSINGRWGKYWVGGAWISTKGEIVPYRGQENGDPSFPEGVLDNFTREIVIAGFSVLDQRAYEILVLLGESPEEWSADQLYDWIDENPDSKLSRKVVSETSEEIWGMISGTNSIDVLSVEKTIRRHAMSAHSRGKSGT